MAERSVLEKALDFVFVNEGGFSNDAQDRGGATRFGITREEASKWRGRSVSVPEMRNFPIAEAEQIYEAWYWKPLHCGEILHPGVATAMFDIGIVRGIGVPPKYAQSICVSYGAKLIEDGHMGPRTIAAINNIEAELFIEAFSTKARNGFLAIVATRPSQVVFIKGWLARAKRLLDLKKMT